jgi:hypothetical protein
MLAAAPRTLTRDSSMWRSSSKMATIVCMTGCSAWQLMRAGPVMTIWCCGSSRSSSSSRRSSSIISSAQDGQQ